MHLMVNKKFYDTTPEGKEVTEFTLTNIHGMVMSVINYGCTITSLSVPDRNGVFEDVVLGFDNLEGYLQSTEYIGCIVGRFANRIAFGKFSLDGNEYTLATNLPPHHLHGGAQGINHAVWEAEEIETENSVGVRFKHLSPDGDEGFPGNLHLEIKYLLGNDNTVSFEYNAVTDKSTIINLTQHSYFNLNGGKEDILDHELTIYADQFIPTDALMIPTGELKNVDNTPFDFRKSKIVGQDISLEDEQLKRGDGYDHTFVIKHTSEDLQHAATLYEKKSGRKMDVYTSEPGVQVYTANFLKSNAPGKGETPLTRRLGICLETQHFPDSPNQPSFPSVELKPGEKYYSKTVLTFRN
jgi:aldose 1-epimerase